MLLHVPTIFVALFFAFTLFVSALTFARPFLVDRAELRLWAWSTWMLLAGFIALMLRAVWPEWTSVLLGNGLMFASLFMISQALHRFVLHRSAPRWHAGLLVAGWACTALVLGSPLALRTAVISALYAAQLVPVVWLIVTRGWHAEASLRTVAVTLGLTAVALLCRVGHALIHPDEYLNYFQTSLGNSLTYLGAFLFPLGAGFGFVLANLERVAHRLGDLASHDAMTGCLNRGAFDATLGHAVERARRAGQSISLLLIDLDDFKAINDARGHQAGDAALRAFADALRRRLRAADVFGRLGGDEFGVLLTDTDTAGTESVAEALRTNVEALQVPTPDGASLRLTISIGVSTASADRGSTLESLYADADRSLYRAKRGGRNQVGRAPETGREALLSTAGSRG